MPAYKSAADPGELSLRKLLSYLRKGTFAGYNAARIATTNIAMRMPEVAASSKRNGVEIYEVEQEHGTGR